MLLSSNIVSRPLQTTQCGEPRDLRTDDWETRFYAMEEPHGSSQGYRGIDQKVLFIFKSSIFYGSIVQ